MKLPRHPLFWLVIVLVAIYVYAGYRSGRLPGRTVPVAKHSATPSPVVQASPAAAFQVSTPPPGSFTRKWGF